MQFAHLPFVQRAVAMKSVPPRGKRVGPSLKGCQIVAGGKAAVHEVADIGVGHGSLLSTVRCTDCDFVFGVIPPINRWAIIIRPLGRTGRITFCASLIWLRLRPRYCAATTVIVPEVLPPVFPRTKLLPSDSKTPPDCTNPNPVLLVAVE